MAIDQRLRDTEFLRECSWGKVISYLKKQFDQWALERLAESGYADFRIGHMPLIMNIDLEGTNNNELAKRARISKQAMSKVLKELQQAGYIQSRVDPQDNRSVIFSLTERGKKFVLDARMCVKNLMDNYRKEIGNNEFEDLVQKLVKIIEFNDRLLTEVPDEKCNIPSPI